MEQRVGKRLSLLILAAIVVLGLLAAVWLQKGGSAIASAAVVAQQVGDAPTGRRGPATVTATPSPTSTCIPGVSNGPWTLGSVIPLAARNFAMDSDGTYAYAAGGSNRAIGGPINRFSRYNPATNSWTLLTPLPVPAMGASVVYAPINNKIYVFGGFSGSNVFTDNQVYDIATGAWSQGAFMPDARWMMAAGYSNGKIYLATGGNSCCFDGIQAQLWEYDPVADSWNTNLPPVPGGRLGSGYGAANGHFYVLGGADTNGNPTNTTYDYDIAGGTWTTRANLSTAVYAPGSAVVDGRIWLFGGGIPFTGGSGRLLSLSDVPDVINITQIYNPGGNNWINGPRLNAARNLPGGTTVGNRVIAVGGLGNTGGNDIDSTEVSVVSLGGCVTGTPTAPVTATRTPTRTMTPKPTYTGTITGTITSTRTPTNSVTPAVTITATGTEIATSTDTPTTTPTRMMCASSDCTPTATRTPFSTVQPSPTAEFPFTDVHDTDYFYEAVRYFYYAGIISGYSDNTFRPGNDTTRGQLGKIVVLAMNWPIDTTGGPHFSDVPVSYVFYPFVETALNHSVVSGYSDHTFHPASSVTRGQLSKIVVLAMGWGIICPQTGHFTDVPPSHPFYCFVETAFSRAIVSGYSDNTFRPAANATRGQICAIVYRAVVAPPTPTNTPIAVMARSSANGH